MASLYYKKDSCFAPSHVLYFVEKEGFFYLDFSTKPREKMLKFPPSSRLRASKGIVVGVAVNKRRIDDDVRPEQPEKPEGDRVPVSTTGSRMAAKKLAEQKGTRIPLKNLGHPVSRFLICFDWWQDNLWGCCVGASRKVQIITKVIAV